MASGRLDLSRFDDLAALEADQALTIVATKSEEVFASHPAVASSKADGELRVNPLYESTPMDGMVRFRLSFPSPEYEDEFGHCRLYLEDDVVIGMGVLEEVMAGHRSPEVRQLMGRRIVLEMPRRYY